MTTYANDIAGPTASPHAPVSPRPPLPTSILETLAARFRPTGIFLIALAADGTVAWHDGAADPFFLRYALPVVRESMAVERLDVPGVCVVTLPCAEKRQPPGTLVLLARDPAPVGDDDVLSLRGHLDLDAGWLAQQARDLPPVDEPTLRTHARFLREMVRDQVRNGALERELDTLSTQLSNTYEELSLIYQVSGGMKVNHGPEAFFAQACTQVMTVIGVRAMGFALDLDYPGRPAPALYGELQLSPELLERLSSELLRALRGRNGPLLVNDLRAAAGPFTWLGADASVRNLLAVPLHREQKLFGCLLALDKREGDFDSVDSKLVHSIANESAIYLENARLFDDVHGLMMGLLHSLTSAVDAKDTYTCGHSERVALLSRHLAREAGLSDEEVEQVYMSGLLHDVGKIGVPEAVLQKAGRLTDEEFGQMKKHPQVGARILQDVPQVRAIIPGVLHHHERWDGSGYPFNLAAEAIPLMGRIICLADSFDAMTSTRTYRAARPFEAALAEIGACAGKHFDPTLAAAFLRTSADGYAELLCDHQNKSRKLLQPRDPRRREPPIVHAGPAVR